MKIGYIRVSTEEQNTARQEVLLRELGVDEVFIDKASGKNADRPELTRMMNSGAATRLSLSQSAALRGTRATCLTLWNG